MCTCVYTLTAVPSVTCPDRKGYARQGIKTLLGMGVHHEYVNEYRQVLGMCLWCIGGAHVVWLTGMGWGSCRWPASSSRIWGSHSGTVYGHDPTRAERPSTPAWRRINLPTMHTTVGRSYHEQSICTHYTRNRWGRPYVFPLVELGHLSTLHSAFSCSLWSEIASWSGPAQSVYTEQEHCSPTSLYIPP